MLTINAASIIKEFQHHRCIIGYLAGKSHTANVHDPFLQSGHSHVQCVQVVS